MSAALSIGSSRSEDPLQQQIVLLNQRVRILEGECKELDKARTAEKAQRERYAPKLPAYSLPRPKLFRCTLLAAKISELESQLRKSLADLKLAQVTLSACDDCIMQPLIFIIARFIKQRRAEARARPVQ
jgi:hypothetical protein